ncbi:MAG: InlB B-repeat-containing protein [Clostridia bacterium]|nr:InlB B-repeat-containing protein [Clostridia bacterium]
MRKMSARVLSLFLSLLPLLPLVLVPLTMPAGAVCEPDGGSEESWLYPASECNRVVNLTLKDQSGSVLRSFTFHTKYGVTGSVSVSLYGYDITDFVSDAGLFQSMTIDNTSGSGLGTYAYIHCNYRFSSSLSGQTINATVTLAPAEDISVTVRHEVEDENGYVSLYGEQTETISYGDPVVFQALSIPGYDLDPAYESRISGPFSYEWLGGTMNIPRSAFTYSYHRMTGSDTLTYTAYHADKQGRFNYCTDRKLTVTFRYTVRTYTVTFDANGGSGAPDSCQKVYGKTLTLPDTVPVRQGYVFRGWGSGPDAKTVSYRAGSSYSANMDKALYAVWREGSSQLFAVTYNPMGGSGAPSSQQKTEGVPLTLSSAVPTKKGYIFQGWADERGGSVRYAPGDTYTSDADLSLFAVWASDPSAEPAEDHYVRYELLGGTGDFEPQIIPGTGSLSLYDRTPAKAGYGFSGWALSAGGNAVYQPGDTVSPAADLTLYAVWTQQQDPGDIPVPASYTVSYQLNGGTGSFPSQHKSAGESLTLHDSLPVRTGYTFFGWSVAPGGSAVFFPADTYTEDCDLTLYAVWQAETAARYQVFFDANGGIDAPESVWKTEGTDLILPSQAPQRSGYAFLGWHENSLATSPAYTAGGIYAKDESVTLYAVWEALSGASYNLSVSRIVFSTETPSPGESMNVTVYIRSVGSCPTSTVPVYLVLGGRASTSRSVSSAAGMRIVQFTITAGTDPGYHYVEARVNWQKRTQESSSSDNSLGAGYTTQDAPAMSLSLQSQNSLYAGEETVLAFRVQNSSATPVLPADDAKIYLTVKDGNGQTVHSAQLPVTIPANGENLVCEKLRLPADPASLSFEATLVCGDSRPEPDSSDNTVSWQAETAPRPSSTVPEATYTETVPQHYRPNASLPATAFPGTSFSFFSYDGTVFSERTCGISFSVSSFTVSCPAKGELEIDAEGRQIVPSGYGISLTVRLEALAQAGLSMPLENCYTLPQKVRLLLPEYAYVQTPGSCLDLLPAQDEEGVFETDGFHIIPLYVQDGAYPLYILLEGIWTPNGPVSAVLFAGEIFISGSLFDDYYLG